jgi:hypothetical protein
MSYEESLRSITLKADDTLGVYTGVPGRPGSLTPNSGNIFRFVKITGGGTVGLAAGGDDAVGVVQNKPQGVDHAATVAIRGVSNVVVGAGGITAGAEVESDANGQAVAQTAGASLGVAIEDGAEGEIAPVLLRMN